MDPESKRLLQETFSLAKENHHMIRALRRHQIYGLIWTVIIWSIALALPVYLYQGYLKPFVSTFSTTTGLSTSGLFGLPTSADIQKLIDSFKAGQ